VRDRDATRPAAILVVDGDDALAYLLQRYAAEAGVSFSRIGDDWPAPPAPRNRRAVVWFPSIERLDLSRPRERGISDDLPVIVCAFPGSETRARELGADFCALEPLSYGDFLQALQAVGIAAGEGTVGTAGEVTAGEGTAP
jgi:hypothetical protein